MSLPDPSRRRRMIIMPLVILGVAALIGYWGTQRDARRMAEIQRHVRQLCDDAASGRAIADRLNNANPIVAEQTAIAIQQVCTSPQVMTNLQVVVTPGDIANIGDGQATHTALLRVHGQDVLGLRLGHQTESSPIEVLGYWRP